MNQTTTQDHPGAGLKGTSGLKSISVRKAGPVRLTSAAHPLYGGSCGINQVR